MNHQSTSSIVWKFIESKLKTSENSSNLIFYLSTLQHYELVLNKTKSNLEKKFTQSLFDCILEESMKSCELTSEDFLFLSNLVKS